jgi:hypothetical protein
VNKKLVTLPFNKAKIHPFLNKLHITAFKLSGNLSKSVIDITMHSWRDSKKQQYWSYIQKWMRFCTEKHAGPMASSVNLVLEYLASLFHAGIGYSELNTA